MKDYYKSKEEMDDFQIKNRVKISSFKTKTGQGSATFKGLVGSDVKSIEDDPNIRRRSQKKINKTLSKWTRGQASHQTNADRPRS